MKGIMVPDEMSYKELCERVYKVVGVNSAEFRILMRVQYKMDTNGPAVFLNDDDDIMFLLFEADHNRPQVYVTVEKIVEDSVHNNYTEDNVRIDSDPFCSAVSMDNDDTNPWESSTPLNCVGRENECGVSLRDCAPSMDECGEAAGTETPMNETPNPCTISSMVVARSEGTVNTAVTGGLIMQPSSSSSLNVEVGQIFYSKDDVKMRLSLLAMKENFELRVRKSNKGLYSVKCIKESCTWACRAVKLDGCDIFKITKLVDTHTCNIEVLNHDHRQASASLIGRLMKNKFGVGRAEKPRNIVADIRQEYGVNISYDKAWRAREIAFGLARGTHEDSYAHLHAYGEAIKIGNPGSHFEIEIDEGQCFKYVFMALGPSIRGFKSCRPVVIVDGTHLKGKYKGTMLVGVCMDGNNQLYPLAYAIVDTETNASWTWFMTHLKTIIGECPGLVFVSDRHSTITHAVREVFPNSFHGLCTWHLRKNITNEFKDVAITDLVEDAARSYRESEFNRLWEQISGLKNGRVRAYMEAIGIERWSRVHQLAHRYDNMKSNSAECFNALTVEARKLPIV